MVTHNEHTKNIKELVGKLAVIYGEVLAIVGKEHTEYSDWLELRRMRDALEQILFTK